MNKKLIKRLDVYIIKKFLGTFFYSILLIISISIIFDFSEKIDDFIENEAPFRAIIFDYYFNFIPYFANLFSGIFTFVSVIYFTSKMAFNSEIIAILSNGVSFKRFLVPYLVAASVICSLSFALGNFIIPHANLEMIQFKYKYLKGPAIYNDKDIHRQIEPGLFIYMSEFNARNDYGNNFSIEKYTNDTLVSKLTSEMIKWDREKKTWTINDYLIREIHEEREYITTGASIDTALNMTPEEFKSKNDDIETMNRGELIKHIEKLQLRGVNAIDEYKIERHRRSAVPFSSFILAIIGASLASRKIRGGIGLHLGIGIALSFTYIMFQQITKVLAISGAFTPFFAMWTPNIVFAVVAYALYRWAAK